ncbi:hypothetical protein WJX74_000134 [Apatococcus lobatus]|uniref:Eukaryotic translation initiation factor 3 subunit I n=1 Tax=Apatococcus lobatus TaxID=904363 RepID=A0AAW1QM31_9CHLO
MRPYLLKGHERPLTQLRFNREGDLLLSCAKDKSPTLWFSEDGKRVGTYMGHNGTVWTADFTLDSTRLITGSADSSARLWDTETGESLFTFQFQEPCRAVDFALGDDMAAISSDPFMAAPARIHIVRIEEDITDQDATPVRQMESDKSGRVSRVQFTDLNKTLLTASEDGCLRRWDVEVGKMIEEKQVHEKQVQDMQLSLDGTHVVTASTDRTSKLVDVQTLETLKNYNTERPANSAAISPIYDHILIGGGQEASQVTTTSSRAGRFESRFFHKIFGEEFGTVRGHFGPINAVAFHPDGRSFTTGGEDGYVRLHHFDADYFSTRFLN